MQNIKFFVGFAVLAMAMGSCKTESTFEERRLAAKALLSGKCECVVDASTEFIVEKRPLIGALVGVVVSSKCDCISDSLAVQFANEYTLEAIHDMEHKPIESLGLILQKVMDKNDKVVLDCVQSW